MSDFNNELSVYVKSKDAENANRLLIGELSKALVKDRENFIEVLREANIPVFNGASDLQLIDAFIKNAPRNKQLLLGAAFLINHRNQTIGFDGESELSDSGVKDAYKAMDEYFNASGVWADAVKGVADLGGKAFDLQNKKKYGALDAKREMTQSVLAQRQAEVAAKEEQKGKTKRTLLIVGGITLAVVLGAVIYFMVKKKK